MSKCPICNAVAKPRTQNPSFPFCGERCKTIDVGKWFNGEYRIETPGAEGGDGDQITEGEDGEDLEVLLMDPSKTEWDVRH
jgi:endogenous inhibitor of DNA gyrase (YacG/DUF329 family)